MFKSTNNSDPNALTQLRNEEFQRLHLIEKKNDAIYLSIIKKHYHKFSLSLRVSCHSLPNSRLHRHRLNYIYFKHIIIVKCEAPTNPICLNYKGPYNLRNFFFLVQYYYVTPSQQTTHTKVEIGILWFSSLLV